MAVEFIGKGSNDSTPTYTPGLHASTQVGDLLLLWFGEADGATSAPTVTGYNLLAHSAGTHNTIPMQIAVYYRWATGTSDGPSFTSSGDRGLAWVETWRGHDPADLVDDVGNASGGNQSTSWGPVDAAVASVDEGSVHVAWLVFDDNLPHNTPAGDSLTWLLSGAFEQGTGQDQAMSAFYALFDSTPSLTNKTITGTSEGWRGIMFVLKAAPPAENVEVEPAVAALSLTTFAPTVTVTIDQRVTPGTLSLVTTAFAPAVATPRVVTPGLAELATTTLDPTVTVGVISTPATAELAITELAPAVSTPRLVTVGLAELALEAFAPAVTVGFIVTPGAAELALEAFAPAVLTPRLVVPGLAELVTELFAPGITVGVRATPGVASLSLETFAPAVLAPRLVTVGAGSLQLQGFAPAVALPVLVTPGVRSLALEVFAPAVRLSQVVTPGVLALVLTGRLAVVFAYIGRTDHVGGSEGNREQGTGNSGLVAVVGVRAVLLERGDGSAPTGLHEGGGSVTGRVEVNP